MKANLRISATEQPAAEEAVQPRPLNLGLLLATMLLLGFGLIMLMSVSGFKQGGEVQPYYYVTHQVQYALFGLLVMFCTAYIPQKWILGMHYLVLCISIIFLVACLFSHDINGVHRWVQIGPVTIQPVEMIKIAVVLYVSYYVSTKDPTVLRRFTTGFLPILILTFFISWLLFMQPNFSGIILIIGLIMSMTLVSKANLLHMIVVAALGIVPLVYYGVSHGYRAHRIEAWLDPFAYAQGIGYHTVQSYLALGNGGLTGMGFGEGTQKLRFLPEPHNDYIMAVLGEELGFVGITVVMALFLFFFYECYRIYKMQQTERGRITVFGLTMVIALNATLNLAVIFGVSPPTGVCMPFFSYGGSNLVCSMLTVGLLLNFSRNAGS